MNPFRYGALALDEAFTNRESEIRELTRDILNGQDVVVLRTPPLRQDVTPLARHAGGRQEEGPRRSGQSDDDADEGAARRKARGHDLRAHRLRRSSAPASGCASSPTCASARSSRSTPTTGTPSFSFDAGYPRQDVDATIERLLELPGQLAAERKRKVALVFDEFQEVVTIDPDLPKLMRSVFQEQPEVAHVYLGSKRHMMERIFNDENEPFWRSARQMELGVIDPPRFEGYLAASFERTGKKIDPETIAAVLETTGGHPYATQELCYFLWEETPKARVARLADYERALADVLRAEHAHFELIWDQASTAQRLTLQALAQQRGRPLSGDYRRRHKLPGASTVQRALQALTRNELVTRSGNEYRIAEPFLADWLRGQA